MAFALLLFMAPLPSCGDSTGAGGSGAGNEGGGGGTPELFCGDGFADPDLGEECDDGNFDNGDGCLTDCTLAKCGDGVAQEGVEDCDDANTDNTDGCVEGCITASCGDGFTQAGVEDCDDGNEEDGDACTSACVSGAGCGNGTVDDGEDCDDGNQSTQDDCIDCVAARCGDGFAQVGEEACDDGNDVDDDTCTNACTVIVPVDYGCPGTVVDVAANMPATLGGNTADSTSTYEGSCGGFDSPEIVYAVTPAASGILLLEMYADTMALDPVLYVKTDCEGAATLACADATYDGGYESIQLNVTGGTTYYVFADGWDGSAGDFYLGATLLTSVPGDDCPGVNIPLNEFNEPYTVSGDTSLAKADRVGTGLCDSPSTKEVVYKIVAPANGRLVAALDPSYDASLYVRTLCTTPSSQLQCSEMGGVGEAELTTVTVTAGKSYFVIVDGWDGDSGPYTIDFTLLPP